MKKKRKRTKLEKEERRKRREENRKKQEDREKKEEDAALAKILNIISTDDFLKYHNITISELVKFADCFAIKVYFICGVYMLEGTISELISDIRHILKEENVQIKIFCPACSSKQLKFASNYCLCNDCGSLSIPEEDKVVKQYKPEDKPFWWAKAMVDIPH